jgi:hypothetical protein
MFGKDLWQQPSSSLLRGSGVGGPSNGSSLGGPPASSLAGQMQPVGDKPALCKYFVNGGCLRGESCSFLHELPDERHLDVNGLGFIFNSNVHNAHGKSSLGPIPSGSIGSALGGPATGGGGQSQAAAVQAALLRKITPPVRRQIPRYRPPEPHLEHNLPPALATAFNIAPADIMSTLMRTMLDSSASVR